MEMLPSGTTGQPNKDILYLYGVQLFSDNVLLYIIEQE